MPIRIDGHRVTGRARCITCRCFAGSLRGNKTRAHAYFARRSSNRRCRRAAYTAHCFLRARLDACIPTRRPDVRSWHLFASSLILFSRNDRERELSPAIIAVYTGTKGAAVKFPVKLRARYGRKEGEVPREAEEGSRRRRRRRGGKKSRTMLSRERHGLSRLAPSSCSCFSLFRGRPGKLHQPRAERCLKLNITRAERLRALKRYDSDNEEQSKALLCAPDDYGR